MTMTSNAYDLGEEAIAAARLVENIVGNAWATDSLGQFTYVTPAALNILGLSLDELNSPRQDDNFSWKRVIHADDYPAAAAAWRHSLESGEPYDIEHRMLHGTGDYGWGRCSGQPLRDSQGRITGWYGAVMAREAPLSEEVYKRNEEVLRESERQLQQLVDAVPALIWSTDASGKPSYINRRLANTVGVSLDELIGSNSRRSLADIHPDDMAGVETALAEAFETGGAFCRTYRQRRADGGYRWTESRAEPLRGAEGDIVQWYGACVDVHDRVVAQEALQESEQQLRQLVDAVPSLTWCLTPDGQPSYFSKELVKWLGVRVEDLDTPEMTRIACAAAVLVHPDDSSEVHEELARCVRTGEPFLRKYRVRRHDGVFRWVEGRAQPLHDAKGKVVQWYGVLIDIEELMRTQEDLRSRERELSQLVDLVPSHIWRLRPDGEPIFFNKQMVDFLGVEAADIDRPGISRLEAMLEAVHPDDAARFEAVLRDCLATGDKFAMQYRLRRVDGEYRWMSSRAEPLRDDHGRIIQWFGLCHDVDEQMRLYRDIAEREARIRRLVESDVIGIVIWDLDGTLIDANDAFLRMVQYDRDDVKAGLRWFDMTPPDWQDVHAREEAEELAATGMMQAREKEYFRKDGSRVPVLIGAACFEGESRQGVAYILDLTERKRAEAALREQERELAQLVNMVPSYLWRITPDGVPVFFNKRLVDFLGFDVDEAEKSHLAAFIAGAIHPEDATRVAAAFEHALASGDSLSMNWRMRRADGVYRWVAASAEAMRAQNGVIAQWYGLCHDIDDQVLAEAELRKSKQQLEQMIDALPVNVLSFDPDRRMTYASQRYLDTVGAPHPRIQDFEALAREVAHPEDLPAMLARALEGFASGRPFINRFRRLCSDGVYRWIEARAQALRDEHGAILQWYIASIDIEEEMQAQEALRERERFVWQLVETLPALIDCAAPDGEPVYRSRQLRTYLGYDLEELNGSGKSRLAGTLDAGVHPDDLAGVKEAYAASLKTGEPYARRHRLRRFDGEYRWVETRAAPMRGPGGEIIQWNVICLDIDGEIRTQEELRLALERLGRAGQAASLAELSASIAHEVNQPLAAVVANSHACQRWLTATPPNIGRAQTTVERIIRDANAAADVVSRIRSLFKQTTQARRSTSLDQLVAEVVRLLADLTTTSGVTVVCEIENGLPPVHADPVQIQQVLTNLVRNATEALVTRPHDRGLNIRAFANGEVVQVEVADNGPGVDHSEKIFDAFFTTKDDGMGMGLAISRSIVEAHGGRLWLESPEAGGAVFAFTLPIEMQASS